jgi:hypothetical protein
MSSLRVFVSAEQPKVDGWEWVCKAEDAIHLLKTGQVQTLCLDYHLARIEHGTGMDILDWIETAVVSDRFAVPSFVLHCANRADREKLFAAIVKILRLATPSSTSSLEPKLELDTTPPRKLKIMSPEEMTHLTKARLLSYRKKALSLENNPEESDYLKNRYFAIEQYDYFELVKELDQNYIWFKSDPRWSIVYQNILDALAKL